MKKWTRLMYTLLMILIMAAGLLPAQKTLADGGPQAENYTISYLEIGGFDIPKAGNKPQTEGFVITEPKDGVTVNNVDWTPAGYFINGQFCAGCLYKLTLELKPKSGYTWEKNFGIDNCVIFGIEKDQVQMMLQPNGVLKISVDFTIKADPIYCTVFFNANGGSGKMNAVTVEKYTEYALPKCTFTAPNGQIFYEWDKGAVGNKISITDNTTLTAQWKSKSVISFDPGEGSGTMNSVDVPSGTEYTLPKCTFTAPNGQIFYEWDKGAVGEKITITGNTTLIAQWKKMPVISFDANGGTESMKSVAVPSGTEYTLPKCTFTAPKGMEFDIWDKGAVGDKITITNNTTIKAIWKNWPVISFDANGGTESMKSVAVPSGTEYTLPKCTFTAPKGMEFDSWDKGAVGDKITITNNTTIKAIWKNWPVISFNTNGGFGSMKSVAVPSGTEYTLPECTFQPKFGWIFDSWDKGAVGGKITITGNTTIKAIWREIPVIYFYANGGTGTMESVEVPSGEYTLPVCTFTAPEGKEFDKWNLGAVGETISIKLSAKLMPVWKDSSNSSAKPGDRLKNAGGIEGQEVLIITPSQVSYTQAPAKSVVTIPSTIKSNGRTYKVTSVEKNAFSRTKARTVIVGKNVKKLKKGAFANSTVKKIILKTKLLRKKTVKGSLKKSKVKTIKVKVGKKKTNKKYVKKYKKIFKKKYSGRKAKVTR